jgi:hypothetical protein
MFVGTWTDPPVGSTGQRRVRAIFNALRYQPFAVISVANIGDQRADISLIAGRYGGNVGFWGF